MAWKAAVTKSSGIVKYGALFYLKSLIFVIWMIFIVFSLYSAYQDNKLPGVFEYLGGEVAIPTFQINEISQDLIEQGGTYQKTSEGFFVNSLDMLKTYWNLIFAFISVWVWVNIFKMFFVAVVTGDTSRVTSNWIGAILMFFLIQIIFIGFFRAELGLAGISIPFRAFYNFFKAIPYLIP
ncbi:MAG: hypothetical protein ACOC3Z_03180 [Nanoarchaeota archaeon]